MKLLPRKRKKRIQPKTLMRKILLTTLITKILLITTITLITRTTKTRNIRTVIIIITMTWRFHSVNSSRISSSHFTKPELRALVESADRVLSPHCMYFLYPSHYLNKYVVVSLHMRRPDSCLYDPFRMHCVFYTNSHFYCLIEIQLKMDLVVLSSTMQVNEVLSFKFQIANKMFDLYFSIKFSLTP